MLQSLPAWGAWVEILSSGNVGGTLMSLPAWGAWVEIDYEDYATTLTEVAPRMGSVG